MRDGFQLQTNVVHADGKRGVLLSILKNGNASTLDVVDARARRRCPTIQATLPPELKITPLFDQSVFVARSGRGRGARRRRSRPG